jgi:hypothetical protein
MKQFKKILVVSLMFIVFTSCQKKDIATAFDEITLSQQETQGEEALADIDLLAEEAVDSNSGQLKSATIANAVYLSDCAVITINNTLSPKVIAIDFGTSCTGKDGKIRSGKIIITSDSFTTFPSVRNKTFDNYYVEGKKIEGTIVKTITKDQENNIRTAVISENITIKFSNGEGSATRIANFTRQYQRGTLASSTDNKIVSWGTVDFTRTSGIKVNKTVTAEKPLVFNVACHHIVSGIVSITSSNNYSWTIDFGTGDCDNIAMLTIGNKTKEIRIR